MNIRSRFREEHRAGGTQWRQRDIGNQGPPDWGSIPPTDLKSCLKDVHDPGKTAHVPSRDVRSFDTSPNDASSRHVCGLFFVMGRSDLSQIEPTDRNGRSDQ